MKMLDLSVVRTIRFPFNWCLWYNRRSYDKIDLSRWIQCCVFKFEETLFFFQIIIVSDYRFFPEKTCETYVRTQNSTRYTVPVQLMKTEGTDNNPNYLGWHPTSCYVVYSMSFEVVEYRVPFTLYLLSSFRPGPLSNGHLVATGWPYSLIVRDHGRVGVNWCPVKQVCSGGICHCNGQWILNAENYSDRRKFHVFTNRSIWRNERQFPY